IQGSSGPIGHFSTSVKWHQPSQRAYASERFSALVLPRILSVLSSKLTFWPSARPERPARSTALMCTNTSLPPSLGWMKPKPFWPLNHFTVPVVIFFSQARTRIPRDDHAIIFNFDDVFGKGARRRVQQGTA